MSQVLLVFLVTLLVSCEATAAQNQLTIATTNSTATAKALQSEGLVLQLAPQWWQMTTIGRDGDCDRLQQQRTLAALPAVVEQAVPRIFKLDSPSSREGVRSERFANCSHLLQYEGHEALMYQF
ncbi:hypothetical protein GQ600_21420 [Phytophthora cactorum]|nr:hypothetical protein GQ600_21420 [Phytophthora cactorum]